MTVSVKPGPSHPDLRALVHSRVAVQAGDLLPSVFNTFSETGQDFIAVLDGARVAGLCSRRETGMLLGSRFGRALHTRKPIRDHMLPDYTVFSVDQHLPDVLHRIAARAPARFYDDAVLVDEEGRFVGLIAVHDLIRLQHQMLASHIRELKTKSAEIDRRNREMEQDLVMARELQMALLPGRYPEFRARRDGIDLTLGFHHRYEPAGCVGGDFLQVVRIADACAGVLICDVMGHGVRSALVTAMLRALIEELRPIAADPGATLTQLNRDLTLILQRPDRPMFVTALYAVLDLAAGTLRLSRAGHPDPLQIDLANGSCRWLRCAEEAAGPALGLFPDTRYGFAEFALEAGCALVLYTDGLIEAQDADGNEFGEERLLQLAERELSHDMRAFCDALMGGVRRFAGGGAFDDDVSIIGVRTQTSPAPVQPAS